MSPVLRDVYIVLYAEFGVFTSRGDEWHLVSVFCSVTHTAHERMVMMMVCALGTLAQP